MSPKTVENRPASDGGKWANGGGGSSPHLNARSSLPSSELGKSSSQLFTSWLLKKSRRCSSSGGETETSAAGAVPVGAAAGTGVPAVRGRFFPAKLALALGMAKCLLGLLLVAFGALALWEKAAMSNLGSGLWCGAVVVVSGMMGIMAGKKPWLVIYTVSFLITSILSLAGIGLLLIFAATGLARDSDAPWGYFVDEEDGNPVEFLGTIPLRQRPVIVNAVLVAFGTLEAILSLASIFICVREACQCYSAVEDLNKSTSVPNMTLLTADQSPEGQARAYRLLRWLGQHRHPNHPPHPPAPVHSRPPRIFTAPVPVLAPVSHPIAYPSFITGAPTAYMIPSMLPSMMAALPTVAAYTTGYAPFYSLSMPSLHHSDGDQQRGDLRKMKREKRRRNRKKSAGESGAESAPGPAEFQSKNKSNHSAADDKILTGDDMTDNENHSYIYTGMDREIPEEFILHSLEPSKSNRFRKIASEA